MIIAGIIGGLSNLYITENLLEKKISIRKVSGYMIISLTASFLVPLFLNTLESSLITNIIKNKDSENTNEILIFFGFCVLASISSNKFIQNLSNKLLQSTQDKIDEVEKNTKKKLDDAQKEIKKLNTDLQLANLERLNTENELKFQKLDIKRQTENIKNLKTNITEQEISNNLTFARFILESGELEDAQNNYEEILKKYPNNIKAQIGKAVALKRIGVENKQGNYIIESLKIIDNVIDNTLETNDPEYELILAKCLYNKACFEIALSSINDSIIDEEKIKTYLSKCFKLRPAFSKYALKDKDFDPVVELDWFKKICNNYL